MSCGIVHLQVSLKEGFTPSQKEQLKVVRKSNILDKMPAKAAPQQSSNNAEAAAAPALPPVSIVVCWASGRASYQLLLVDMHYLNTDIHKIVTF